jgi:hypothetical protein
VPEIDRDEVLALLPWLAAGSLPASDVQRIERWLAEQGDAADDVRDELAWLRVTAGQVKAGVQLPSADLGLDQLLRRVRADESPADSPAESPVRSPTGAPAPRPLPVPGGWRDALRRWWETPARGWALGGLTLAQAAVIAVLLWQPPGSDQEPLSDPRLPALGDAVLLQVTFAPTATEAQIRAALQQARATLVGGPGALGLYTVAVPRANAAAATAALQQQAGVVESVAAMGKP